jgi:V/A-type H+-transporting ATPase subunit I
MKKLSLFVLDKQKEDALTKIRDLGLVHIERKTVSSTTISDLNDRKNRVDLALNILKNFTPQKGEKLLPVANAPSVDKDLINRIIKLSETRKALGDEIFNNTRDISRFDKWGNFNPKDIKRLNEHNVTFLLYEISFTEYESLKEERVIVLGKDKKKKKVRLVAFDKLQCGEPYQTPDKSIPEIEALSNEKRAEIAVIETELKSFYKFIPEIEKRKKWLDAEIEFESARVGMEPVFLGDDAGAARYAISLFSGYVPANSVGVLRRAASENGWALYADDPAEDDFEVPTKLKNNKFVSLLYPLTDFLEIVPGYREVDITGAFLVFFCVFFGMIFSDAAYGLVLAAVAIIGMVKTAGRVPAFFKMLLLLAICNIGWGVLTCTWLGLDVGLLPDFLRNISLPLISNVEAAKGPLEKAVVDQNLMILCFSLALLHLGFARLRSFLACLLKKNLKFFSELGQLSMLLGMFNVVLFLVVSNSYRKIPLLPISLYLLIGGFALVFIFGNYEGSVIKSILSSFANFISTVLGITNVFSDIMSYIRLWAVGLAGASVASTVNSMAGPMMGHFLMFAAIVLLIVGHGFNMALNTLSVIVHGVRLNTLEFSSHIGLTWSGIAYKPFAKRLK